MSSATSSATLRTNKADRDGKAKRLWAPPPEGRVPESGDVGEIVREKRYYPREVPANRKNGQVVYVRIPVSPRGALASCHFIWPDYRGFEKAGRRDFLSSFFLAFCLSFPVLLRDKREYALSLELTSCPPWDKIWGGSDVLWQHVRVWLVVHLLLMPDALMRLPPLQMWILSFLKLTETLRFNPSIESQQGND